MRRCTKNHRAAWIFRDNRWTEHRALLWCPNCGAVRSMPEDKKWTYPLCPPSWMEERPTIQDCDS